MWIFFLWAGVLDLIEAIKHRLWQREMERQYRERLRRIYGPRYGK